MRGAAPCRLVGRSTHINIHKLYLTQIEQEMDTYGDKVFLHEGCEHVVSDGGHDITEVHG